MPPTKEEWNIIQQQISTETRYMDYLISIIAQPSSGVPSIPLKSLQNSINSIRDIIGVSSANT